MPRPMCHHPSDVLAARFRGPVRLIGGCVVGVWGKIRESRSSRGICWCGCVCEDTSGALEWPGGGGDRELDGPRTATIFSQGPSAYVPHPIVRVPWAAGHQGPGKSQALCGPPSTARPVTPSPASASTPRPPLLPHCPALGAQCPPAAAWPRALALGVPSKGGRRPACHPFVVQQPPPLSHALACRRARKAHAERPCVVLRCLPYTYSPHICPQSHRGRPTSTPRVQGARGGGGQGAALRTPLEFPHAGVRSGAAARPHNGTFIGVRGSRHGVSNSGTYMYEDEATPPLQV